MTDNIDISNDTPSHEANVEQSVTNESKQVSNDNVSNEKSEVLDQQETWKEHEKDNKQKVPDDNIVLKKSELDARATSAIKAIAERKAKNRYDAELARYKEQAQLSQVQPQQEQGIWDENLGRYIPPDLTIRDYQKLCLGEPVNMQPKQPMVQPQAANSTQNVNNNLNANFEDEDEAEFQIITLKERIPDFEDTFKGSMIPLESLVNMTRAVSTDPEGVLNLYNAIKEKPHEMLKISRLSPMAQQQKMWELNQEVLNRKTPKVKSNATPQPAPLASSGGKVNKSYDDMTYSEKKAYIKKNY